MLIVITDTVNSISEMVAVRSLFENGLQTLHLRKPDMGKQEYEKWLQAIPHEHKRKIILHQHHELVAKYNVKGLHLKEAHRKSLSTIGLRELKKRLNRTGMLLSSSFHAIEEIKSQGELFDHVFLSPVFESISKPGYSSSSKLEVRSLKLKKTKVIALGGVHASNMFKAKEMGFDGVAVLGAVWQDPEQANTRFISIKAAYEAAFSNFETK